MHLPLCAPCPAPLDCREAARCARQPLRGRLAWWSEWITRPGRDAQPVRRNGVILWHDDHACAVTLRAAYDEHCPPHHDGRIRTLQRGMWRPLR